MSGIHICNWMYKFIRVHVSLPSVFFFFVFQFHNEVAQSSKIEGVQDTCRIWKQRIYSRHNIKKVKETFVVHGTFHFYVLNPYLLISIFTQNISFWSSNVQNIFHNCLSDEKYKYIQSVASNMHRCANNLTWLIYN